jgi:hypothetical protein
MEIRELELEVQYRVKTKRMGIQQSTRRIRSQPVKTQCVCVRLF